MIPAEHTGISTGTGAAARFPATAALRRDFIWGVSTSAFQIEGATREDGRGLSVWDTYGLKGQIANKDTGDIACDHYLRAPGDCDHLFQLIATRRSD